MFPYIYCFSSNRKIPDDKWRDRKKNHEENCSSVFNDISKKRTRLHRFLVVHNSIKRPWKSNYFIKTYSFNIRMASAP